MDKTSFSSIGGSIRAFAEVLKDSDETKPLETNKIDFSHIRYINLHNNKLRDLRGLEKCRLVEEINFSANELTLAAPGSVKSLQSRSQIPWKNLQCLTKLDLACNRLRFVRALFLAEIASPEKCTVNCSCCREYDRACIQHGSPTNIHTVSCRSQALAVLSCLHALEELNLSFNKIETLDTLYEGKNNTTPCHPCDRLEPFAAGASKQIFSFTFR